MATSNEEPQKAITPADTIKAKTIHVNVQAGAAREFPISVFPGCFIEYSFHTKGGDIGFGILLETPEQNLKTVLERERVNAHEEAINGKIRCTQSGTLWFMWDNTHSWFMSKDLVYSVTRQPQNTDINGSSSPTQSTSPGTLNAESTDSSPAVSDVNGSTETVIYADSQNPKPLRVILGTMTMGGQVTAKDSVKMIQNFIDLDPSEISELDTARMYNKGKTEILLGEILNAHSNIKNAVSLATKANPFKGFNENLRPENVRKQLHDSLSALKLQHTDIFYLHAPDHFTNIEDTLRTVNELYKQGKFRTFALSNYAAWEVMEIYHLCDKNDWIKPTLYQGMYNAITREVEKELLPCLRRLNMKFYAYNPLAGGLLSGKYTKNLSETEIKSLLDNKPNEGRFKIMKMYLPRYWQKEYLQAIYEIQKVCDKFKISLCHASLRWISWHSDMNANYNDGVIIGVSNHGHLHDNMAALNLDKTNGPLPKEIVDAFDSAWASCKAACPSYNR